jgi:glutamate-1-semialdehyde 2,1-aminomutase
MEDEPADYADLMANDDALFVRFRQELISRGVFEFPTPLKRSHIGYSHTEDHLDRTLAAAKPALAAALSQLTPTS